MTVVGLLPFLLVLSSLSGCGETGDGNEVLSAEEAKELGLSGGARLHRVTLGGRGADEHAVPTRIEAFPGDGIEFLTVDHRVHTLEFVADSLHPEAQLFLESTGQTASPPLVSRGSRFILTLRDAPPGTYRFTSNGHGGVARGVVEVGVPEGDTVTNPSS